MKRYLSVFVLAIIVFIITGCTGDDITKVTYHGKSFNWESTMIFDEEDKQSLNIKYLGQEQLPIDVSFSAEFLSGNGSGGCVEYGELANEVFGGFTFEDDYDKKIHGDVSKYRNKDSLKVIIKWNDKEETIVLNKVD